MLIFSHPCLLREQATNASIKHHIYLHCAPVTMSSSHHDHDDPPSNPSQQQQQQKQQPQIHQAATSTSTNKQRPKKRAKTVTFSEEVLSQSNGGGSKVVIREERGVFLGPLLGRMVISSDESAGDEEDDGDVPRRDRTDREMDAKMETRGGGRVISFDMGTDPPKDAMDIIRWNEGSSSTYSSPSYCSFSTDDDDDARHRCGDNVSERQIQRERNQARSLEEVKIGKKETTTTYENLVIKMGLLKCGHRYRVVVPLPDDVWRKSAPLATSNNRDGSANDSSSYEMNVRIVEDSLDDDLRGVIELQQVLTEDEHGVDDLEHEGVREEEGDEMAVEEKVDNSRNTNRNSKVQKKTAPVVRPIVDITLSARRRGPYRGRFVLESTRQRSRDVDGNEEEMSTQPTENANAATENVSQLSNNNNNTATAQGSASTLPTYCQKKCVVSLQVDATIMGKDMGTPKLRNGVTCLGKIVGYDSDEETEWQGFD
ncbi:hypothetical protein ACHAXS_003156 [Conticribra weissflogii]